MAELICTEEEKQVATYLEWSDEALGRAVKKIALLIGDKKGKEAISIVAAAGFLIANVVDSNSERSTLTLEGVTIPQNVGDWRITIERIGNG